MQHWNSKSRNTDRRIQIPFHNWTIHTLNSLFIKIHAILFEERSHFIYICNWIYIIDLYMCFSSFFLSLSLIKTFVLFSSFVSWWEKKVFVSLYGGDFIEEWLSGNKEVWRSVFYTTRPIQRGVANRYILTQPHTLNFTKTLQ